MQLSHFKSTQDTLEYTFNTLLWALREDLAAMTGSAAEQYSEKDCRELEDKIADIQAVLSVSISDNAA